MTQHIVHTASTPPKASSPNTALGTPKTASSASESGTTSGTTFGAAPTTPSTMPATTSGISSASAPDATATCAYGVRRAVPVIFGYVPVGLAFGVLAVKAGLTPFETMLMSALVYAGSAQLIAVGLLGAASSFAAATWAVIFTTCIVNLRLFLMSAALAPYLRHWGRGLQAFFAWEITDESFALHSIEFQRLQQEAGAARPEKCTPVPVVPCLALNITAHLAWIIGSGLGALSGSFVADVRPLGIDYALNAMFIILLVAQIRNNLHIAMAVLAAACSVGLYMADIHQWNVILATLFAATVGTMLTLRGTAQEAHHA